MPCRDRRKKVRNKITIVHYHCGSIHLAPETEIASDIVISKMKGYDHVILARSFAVYGILAAS